MEKNTSSNNQKGGITASKIGQINIHGDVITTTSEKSKKYPIIKILILIGTVVSIWMGNSMNDKATIFNVSSVGQQGGITVGQIEQLNINAKPTPRTLIQNHKDELDTLLSEHHNLPIIIVANNNDKEAYNFGEQIYNYLVSKGHKAEFGGTAPTKPMRPLVFVPLKDKIFIEVGPQE